jgi:hypothetical protein
MAVPVYPKALSGWTDRINNVDIVWAADPNTLAAEIISIESTVGTMPMVEPNPPVGKPLTFSSVSARISDVQNGYHLPYVELIASNFRVGYGSYFNGVPNVYQPLVDDFNYFNGSDISIGANGIYVIDVFQVWQPWVSGYVNIHLTINNNLARTATWSWDSVPTNGPISWQNRTANAGIAWMGPLQYGDRVRVVSENGTNWQQYGVNYSSFRAQFIRSLSNFEASLEPSASPM